MLLSFSVSFAFFNHGHIYASVPLSYPPLIYLLARMLALMRPGSVRGDVRPLRLLVPVPWLAVGVVLLIGFRIALNVTDSLHTIYEETIGHQANRESPFSVWGLYGGLGGLRLAVQIAVVALAVVRRRPDVVGLAAACGALIIATQLGIQHWFYLYIPWFFPLVMLALLGPFGAPLGSRVAGTSPSRPAVAA